MKSTEPDSSRSRFGCLLRGILALFLIAALLVGIQKWITPPDDPNLTGPEVSEYSDAANDPAFSVPESAATFGITQAKIDAAEHPLIPVLEIAARIQTHIEEEVADYSANITSKVRTDDGVTHPEKVSICKVRHESEAKRFGVYTKFLNPGEVAGQEAIWVKGENDGKLVGHGTGLLNVKRMYLNPDGLIPMMGNRHPIYKLGIKNLIVELISNGEKDLKDEELKVEITRGVDIDGMVCTMLTVEHPVKREQFEYFIAKIYIDDSRNLPVAFESRLWPEKKGDEPPLLERYFYTDIQLNIGLTDDDFDPSNEAYNYPSW